MVCERGDFSGAVSTVAQGGPHRKRAAASALARLPVVALRHRVAPYEAMLRSQALARLTATEARIAELETALREGSEQASHDPLTGVLNRRGLLEEFGREAARARRMRAPLAVALIDLDDFKAINDRHGHAVGDVALVHLTRVLAQTLRPTDVCGRWGGTEFVVLMPGADHDAAKRALARAQKAIAGHAMALPLALFFSADVVVGASGESLEQLLARADGSRA